MKKGIRFDVVYVSGFDEDNNPIFEFVEEFCEKDRDSAYKFITKYNKNHTDKTYYYRHHIDKGVGIVYGNRIAVYTDKVDGISDAQDYLYKKLARLRKTYKDLKRNGKDTKEIVKKIAKVRRLFTCKPYMKTLETSLVVFDWIEWYLFTKWVEMAKDFWYGVKRIAYFIRYKHDSHEFWGLDEHVLGDLKWNIRRLMNEGCSVSPEFVDMAALELNKDNPNFKLDEFWRNQPAVTEEIDELSVKLRNETYNKIIHLIDLYKFYCCDWYEQDDGELSMDMKYIYMPGTYNEIDFNKMFKRAEECWNEIFDLFKKHGRGMWD